MYDPSKKNLDNFIFQAMIGNTYALLCGGIYLSGFLLFLGASDNLVSYIGIIGSICGISTLFIANWIQGKEKRKALLIPVNIISKMFTISSIFVPLIFPQSLWVIVAFTFVIIANIFAAINGLIFNTWMVQLVPQHIRGRYFGVRQIFAITTGIIVPILSGIFLDYMHKSYEGYFSLYMMALVVGIIEMFIFARIDEVKIKTSHNSTDINSSEFTSEGKVKTSLNPFKVVTRFFSTFEKPLKDKKFMSFLLRACVFHIFFYMSITFNQVYMIKYLNLSFFYITILGGIASALQILIFCKFWGIVADRLSSRFVYIISMSIFFIDAMFWFFIKPSTMYILMPILYAISAVEWSGFNISIFKEKYEVMPEEGRVVYDSLFTFALGIVLLISPFIGTLLRNFFSNISFIKNMQFGEVRIPFLISSILLVGLSISNFFDAKKNDPESLLFDKKSYLDCWYIFKKVFIDLLYLLIKVLIVVVIIGIIAGAIYLLSGYLKTN